MHANNSLTSVLIKLNVDGQRNLLCRKGIPVQSLQLRLPFSHAGTTQCELLGAVQISI